MRRGDKEVTDRAEIDAIIDSAAVCRLGLVDDGDPYIVPVCFGYDGQCLYLHGAPAGRKMALLAASPRICLEFDDFAGVVEGDAACAVTARYRSAIGWGRAEILDDRDEKRHGLALVLARYTNRRPDFSDEAIDATAVVRIEIDSLTGKRSGWGDDG